jgi:Uncharacterised nucleotidyltransferase
MSRVGERPPRAQQPSLEGIVAGLVLDSVAAEVAAAFRERRVPFRLLKGAATTAWLYEGEERSYVDVDFLVPPRDVGRAELVLRERGFTPAEGATAAADRPRHARVWERVNDAALVDLHAALAGVGIDPQEAWDVLSSSAGVVSIRGEPVETLDLRARALHVALHAGQHGMRSPQALADLERALARVPFESWREAADLARRLNAVPAFLAGLGLASAGEAIARRLDLSSVSSVESDLRVRVEREETLGAALGFEWLAGQRGVRKRVAFLLRKLAPPPASMRRRSALARKGRLGLSVAYVTRVVRLTPHVTAGFLAWRKARRRAS